MGFLQRSTTLNVNKFLYLLPIVLCVCLFGCDDDDDSTTGTGDPYQNVPFDLEGTAWVNVADSTDTLYFLLEPYEQTQDFLNPGTMVNARRNIYDRYFYELYIAIIDVNHIDVDFVNIVIRSRYGYYVGIPPEDQVMDLVMNGHTGSIHYFRLHG